MGILAHYRIQEAVKILCSSLPATHPRVVRATERIRQAGSPAIQPLIEALDKALTSAPLEALLRSLLHTTTLPCFFQGLSHTNPRVVKSVVAVLSQAEHYNPHALLGLFHEPDVSPLDLLHILACQRQKLRPEAVLELVDTVRPETLPLVLDLVDHTASAAIVPGLIAHTYNNDWLVRLHMTRTLSRFGTVEVHTALVRLLNDQDVRVREAVLDGLARLHVTADNTPICQLLQDPSLTLQSKVIETLLRLNDPATIPPLLALLHNASAHVRRGAMEVLHAIGDRQTLADLQHALHDTDWWVRARASDALQRVGGADLLEGAPDRYASDDATACYATPVSSLEMSLLSARSALHDDTSSADQEPTTGTGRESGRRVRPYKSGQFVDPALLKPGTMLAERYRVLHTIGRGAFGTIILVNDTVLHEDVILKFLHREVSPDDDTARRFVHELRFARKITHENVIRIYNFLSIGRTYAISMEYFPSHNLADELRESVPLDLHRGLHITEAICQGMSAAHKTHIVHRDLKPQNVLINDADLVKIVDFGLATALSTAESRLTRSGIFLGTPVYIAPEQFQGGKLDYRTDIYSLGIMMYELFTGVPPYYGDNTWTVLFQHVEGRPTPPRERNVAIPPALEAIILKAMATSPDDRYASMDELQESLAAVSELCG